MWHAFDNGWLVLCMMLNSSVVSRGRLIRCCLRHELQPCVHYQVCVWALFCKISVRWAGIARTFVYLGCVRTGYRTGCPTKQAVLQNRLSYRTGCPTEQAVLQIYNNNNNLLFIHTLLNLNRNSKVQAVSSLRTFPHPFHLTRPHPHAVGCKVIIICIYIL